ncbi:MAG: SAM-dependent methyltransferase [Lachnospiraceae bacterium]|nr:SAM-dependent methyltransferase [Lachnospiraceae bacterium]
MNEEINAIIYKIFQNDPDKIIFSNPSGKSEVEFRKVVFNKISMKDSPAYQIEKYTQNQVYHENISPGLLSCTLSEYFDLPYRQVNVYCPSIQMEIKFNKKKEPHIIQRYVDCAFPHIKKTRDNREKDYILKEGTNIPVFVELGIFTTDLKIRNSMQDKFRQINRFAEFIDDCLKDYPRDDVNIIDFGCGKSYLTFVVYHYIKTVRGLHPHIVGLDLKTDVINKCNDLAARFGYEDISFKTGDINGFKSPFDRVDMVLTLHACDTATDYALYNAIRWNADIILSVPCCQHEVNGQISSDRLKALTKYGLVKERVSALITDSIRGCMMEYSGYRTDLMEFVEIEHSPKNILIRGRKRNVSAEKRQNALNEARNLCDEFNISQTLMKLLLKETDA